LHTAEVVVEQDVVKGWIHTHSWLYLPEKQVHAWGCILVPVFFLIRKSADSILYHQLQMFVF
jgi:hypothetical protein